MRRSALNAIVIAVAIGPWGGALLSVALNPVLARWSIRRLDDPYVLVSVFVTLLLSVVAATLIPVRRDTAIDPAIALRSE